MEKAKTASWVAGPAVYAPEISDDELEFVVGGLTRVRQDLPNRGVPFGGLSCLPAQLGREFAE